MVLRMEGEGIHNIIIPHFGRNDKGAWSKKRGKRGNGQHRRGSAAESLRHQDRKDDQEHDGREVERPDGRGRPEIAIHPFPAA